MGHQQITMVFVIKIPRCQRVKQTVIAIGNIFNTILRIYFIVPARIENNQLAGAVQVFHDNHWGYVCDSLWSKEDAQVLCRQLGHRRGEVSNGLFRSHDIFSSI